MIPPHQAALTQFRAEVDRERLFHNEDTLSNDDATLARFLRARSYNVPHAKKMLQDCLIWRRSVENLGIDEIYRSIDPFDYPEREAVFKCWPMWYHKTDKLGRPINIQSFGAIDMPGLYKHITARRHWQVVLVNAEALLAEVLPAASATAGRHIEQSLVIVDLKGFSLSQFWQMKSLARSCFEISQNYMPETMGQLAIINAPASFTFIWAAIKPWLSAETVRKVDILGADYTSVLLDLVAPENLPVALGGTCTCADANGGCLLSNAGPWMDEGRAERRARWLRHEPDSTPGVPWFGATVTHGTTDPEGSGCATVPGAQVTSDTSAIADSNTKDTQKALAVAGSS